MPSRTRSLLCAAFDIGRLQTSPLPPAFLLPCRARLHQAAASSATQFQSTPPEIPPYSVTSAEHLPLSPSAVASAASRPAPAAPLTPSNATPQGRPLILSNSIQDMLPLLEAQKPHYISAHIHRFPYILTEGDTLRLPFHMHGVSPGDVLRFNRASILGSRDYTLKAGMNATEVNDGKRTGEPQYLDERLFECRVRVLGVDSGPMMIKEKTKRRQRRVKTVRSKHKYTVLKVVQVKVKGLEELQRTTGQLILGSEPV